MSDQPSGQNVCGCESTYDHGAPDVWEITWQNGHVERITAQQVLWPTSSLFDPDPARAKRVTFHGCSGGAWRLILSVPEGDVRMVRNVTRTEELTHG